MYSLRSERVQITGSDGRSNGNVKNLEQSRWFGPSFAERSIQNPRGVEAEKPIGAVTHAGRPIFSPVYAIRPGCRHCFALLTPIGNTNFERMIGFKKATC